jgi:ABC-type phosphate/phosphonate transport system substrate-binding protein
MMRLIVALALSLCALAGAAHGQQAGDHSDAGQTPPSIFVSISARQEGHSCV